MQICLWVIFSDKCDYIVSFAEFEDDPDLYVLKPIKYVGVEVWQVRFEIAL